MVALTFFENVENEMSDTITIAQKPETQAQVAKPAKPTKQPKVATKVATRQLKAEGLKKTVEISGRKATATYTVAQTKGAPEYVFTTTFDFTGLTNDEILELALSSVRIAYQARLRNLSDAEFHNPETGKLIDVKRDIVNAQRQSVDDLTKAARALARVSGISEQDARKIVENHAKK